MPGSISLVTRSKTLRFGYGKKFQKSLGNFANQAFLFAKSTPGRRWADGNTSPTRKRGDGTIPRLRVGLVFDSFPSSSLGTYTLEAPLPVSANEAGHHRDDPLP